MRRLIINADDLGMNPARSHGIFQCAEFGVVTSATIIANGSDAQTAARRARERGLPCGAHVNLTEGTPLCKTGDVESLLEGTGEFRGRPGQRRALDDGAVDPVHVARETRAQLEWFQDHCGQPTHVDGHHHIHIHPAVAAVIIPILERHGIGKIRLPLEEPLPPYGYDVPDDALAWTRAINAQSMAARALYAAHGIVSPDHFRGLTLVGRASQKNLRHIVTRLPEGTTELMVHPGSPTPVGNEFDRDPQRQTELQMLCNPESRVLLQERGIALISFADLP